MNLFLKIFVAFGIAMTLTLVAAVYISFRLASLAFDQQNIENRETIIERAAQTLADGGEDRLRRWLRQNPMPSPGIVLMVLDESGEDLLGRPLPPRFEQLLRSPQFRPRNGPPNFRPPQYTATIAAADGREYRLLFVRTRITVAGILSWPATQVAVLILVVIGSAVTSLLLARYLASPIMRLQRASRALAAGSLEARVGNPFVRRKDEVGTLARDFDAMAEHIQALVTDKDLLLRDVSHELRSPLARIRVALALAQRKANESAQADLNRIEQETERLDGLVGQILTLARLRTPSTRRRERLPIGELVGEIVGNARFEHATAQIRLESVASVEIIGDRGELASAIENVLRNALSHSEPDGVVHVKVARCGGFVEILIKDEGPGVSESGLQRIFEPFYRVDPSRDHQRSGFGLGLAIAASAVEKHRGAIVARNSPGGGLEVSIKLPLRRGADGLR